MHDIPESEAKRLNYNLKVAAFDYFLWSLPIATPLAHIAELVDELTTLANKMAVNYYACTGSDKKGIPDKEAT
jgi:hypothetical protein